MLRLLLLPILLFRAHGALRYAKVGDNVTLPCHYGSYDSNLCWFKLVPWEQPQMIFSFYKYIPTNSSLSPGFPHHRFNPYFGEGFCHLNISILQHSDSALYFCGVVRTSKITIKEGTFLVLKDSSRTSFFQEPSSLSVSPGGRATLTCTVPRATKDPQHSVYWFKKESGRPHLIMLDVHSETSGQCVQSPGSTTWRCVYTLFKSSVNRSDSGMYYCAVAPCGEIGIGIGTRLEVGGHQWESLLVSLYGVTAVLLASVILNVFLAAFICHRRRKHLQTKESELKESAPEYTTDIQDEESDGVQYVALELKKGRGRGRRQRNTEEDTIYSGLRPSDME